MILADLKIHHLRTIASASLTLNARFNFIIGANGSGKTSILEALYLLSCGHSFRSREITPIISYGQDTMTVFAQAQDHSSISIQKSSSLPTQVKLNNQFCSSASQLAYVLPCQILYADIFQIIDAGASVRRSLLDWGLFHVKPNYLSIWKEYKRVLKQRNFLLKKSNLYEEFIPWDKQLARLAEQLNELRQEYFLLWQKKFFEVLSHVTNTTCTINYYKGWDRKQNGILLEQILAEQFLSDKQRLYTQYGAHQADIHIATEELKAKHILSRGQQKIILIAMKLAQGQLLDQPCLYLFDDLPAELDEIHQTKLVHYLTTCPGQYIITSTQEMISTKSINPIENASFSIDAGVIQPFVSRETFIKSI